MISPKRTAEIIRLSRRIVLHLLRDQYNACHDILRAFEKQTEVPEGEPVAIAELPLDLRYINMLESVGYVYIEDFEGIDIDELLNIRPHFGPSAVCALKAALGGYTEGAIQSGF